MFHTPRCAGGRAGSHPETANRGEFAVRGGCTASLPGQCLIATYPRYKCRSVSSPLARSGPPLLVPSCCGAMAVAVVVPAICAAGGGRGHPSFGSRQSVRGMVIAGQLATASGAENMARATSGPTLQPGWRCPTTGLVVALNGDFTTPSSSRSSWTRAGFATGVRHRFSNVFPHDRRE